MLPPRYQWAFQSGKSIAKERTSEMDFNLAALKVTVGKLKEARQISSTPSSMSLGGILFQRAWVQGVLVSCSKEEDGHYLLDDGSDVIEVILANEFRQRNWKLGMYVMVVGLYAHRADEAPMIRVHKMVDLSPFPDREAMWHLEVIEAYKLFYHAAFEE